MAKTNMVDGTTAPGKVERRGPQHAANAGNSGPRFCLDVVRDDMTYRWLRGTSITTIRRKLGVSIPVAEEIVRKGIQARDQRRPAA